MAKYGKWIGGGLGWALGGPIGGILGFVFGAMFDGMQSGEFELGKGNVSGMNAGPRTQKGDFAASLIILSATVMKADGKVLKSELDFVKNFFIKQFGSDIAQQSMLVLREVLKQQIRQEEVAGQIKQYMDYSARLQLLHFLFGISRADGHVHSEEVNTIENISRYLGISNPDFNSIRAMFYKDVNSAYRILEASPDASDEELKKAYRKMAVKYHPDKVSHLGSDVQKAANEKFQELNAAWEQVKKERGIV
ncbi:MAG: TerB family tellurite resistance protein [Bacteroidales bacterium]|nr:TerB family tellurite resistance protein [Bacteroidales bacterium]